MADRDWTTDVHRHYSCQIPLNTIIVLTEIKSILFWKKTIYFTPCPEELWAGEDCAVPPPAVSQYLRYTTLGVIHRTDFSATIFRTGLEGGEFQYRETHEQERCISSQGYHLTFSGQHRWKAPTLSFQTTPKLQKFEISAESYFEYSSIILLKNALFY